MNSNLKGSPLANPPSVSQSLEYFSFIRDGFANFNCDGTNNMNDCIAKSQSRIDQNIADHNQIAQLETQMTDLSNNVMIYNQTLLSTGKYQDYRGDMLYPPAPSLQDAIIEDNNAILLSENTLQLTAFVTMSVLLISAIMLAKD
jgi:hypothetical protein